MVLYQIYNYINSTNSLAHSNQLLAEPIVHERANNLLAFQICTTILVELSALIVIRGISQPLRVFSAGRLNHAKRLATQPCLLLIVQEVVLC